MLFVDNCFHTQSQKDDSEVCLGLGVCFTKPSFGLAQFGGITGTVITVTIIMGVLLGCFCAGKVGMCTLTTPTRWTSAPSAPAAPPSPPASASAAPAARLKTMRGGRCQTTMGMEAAM